jgi:hypothetical protein
MPNESQSAITLSSVLGAMRDALGSLTQKGQTSFGELMTGTIRELARVGLTVEVGNDFRGAWQRLGEKHPVSFLLIEGYCQLMTLGYIVPWPSTPNAPNPNWFHTTEKGRQWILSTGPVPEDPDRFIAAMNALVPNLDPVIRQYLVEAVITYSRQAWFAAAVMVGAASEKAIYSLIESLVTVSESASERKAIEKAINERNLTKMFEQISKVLSNQRQSGKLPYSIREGCEHHLLSLFEAIRVQRNEAVHPTIGAVTPESVRLTLSAFPSACRKIYDLIEWTKAWTHDPPK